MHDAIKSLLDVGQSIWMDNIQRQELHNGTLERMISGDGIRGITSNPTIFKNAVTSSRDYDEQIAALAGQGMQAPEMYQHITIQDIRDAARLFLPVYEQTRGRDGFVSIELNPQLARKAEESILEARAIAADVGLPNIMVKVPGTREGLGVVRRLISEGLNVNITLLFSPARYREVAEAYIRGLEDRLEQGQDLADVHSVASFFISRIDTKVDGRIDAMMQQHPDRRATLAALRGQAAVHIARVTYTCFKEMFCGARFAPLQEKGARIQRPLWASTSTKDPAYSDVKYVEGLVAPWTVNTLPPKTIEAFKDHGRPGESIESSLDRAAGVLQQMQQAGIDLDTVYQELLDEGLAAFEKSYDELLEALESKRAALAQ